MDIDHFNRLYEKYYFDMKNYANNLSPRFGDDIVQDVFLSLFQNKSIIVDNRQYIRTAIKNRFRYLNQKWDNNHIQIVTDGSEDRDFFDLRERQNYESIRKGGNIQFSYDFENMKKLYKDGVTLKEIARICNRSITNVCKNLRKYDPSYTKRKKAVCKITESEKIALSKLYESGLSLTEIARKYGRTRKTLRKFICPRQS